MDELVEVAEAAGFETCGENVGMGHGDSLAQRGGGCLGEQDLRWWFELVFKDDEIPARAFHGDARKDLERFDPDGPGGRADHSWETVIEKVGNVFSLDAKRVQYGLVGQIKTAGDVDIELSQRLLGDGVGAIVVLL